MKKAGKSIYTVKQVFLHAFLIALCTLILFRQAGAQPFGQENTLSSGQVYEPIRLVSEDINMDDLPDIIVSSYSHRIDWYSGLGNGKFAM